MTTLSHAARRFDWLITEFVAETPGVAHAVVVSADGLRWPPPRASRRTGPTSSPRSRPGLLSLTVGASRVFEGGAVTQTVVEMQRGLLLVMAISDGSVLAVLASPDCDMGLVAYQMTLLVDRAGQVLTPALRAELQAARSAVM